MALSAAVEPMLMSESKTQMKSEMMIAFREIADFGLIFDLSVCF